MNVRTLKIESVERNNSRFASIGDDIGSDIGGDLGSDMRPIAKEMICPIRPANLHDLSEMDRIEQESFNTPWSRELIRGAIYNMRYDVRVIGSDEQGLLGFYIAHGIQRRGNLDNVVVDRSRRRQGYGRRMLDDWMQRSRRAGHTSLTLQVNVANKGAQTLYEAYGFRARRLLRGYYTNGEDAYNMEMALGKQPAAVLENSLTGTEFPPPKYGIGSGI